MEQAAIPRPATPRAATKLPPGPKAPAIVQMLRYARDPLGFLIGLQRRYGDVFTISFPYFGRAVYVANPELVKALFTGSPSVFHAGEANATVLEPALGPSSVLTLDDEPHMRQRKLLLPPFHGESVQRYGELIREVTVKEMESWPVGEPFALRPHTQRITLAVIMRAVFGVHDEQRLVRFERLIETFSQRVNLITVLPPLRRNLGPWSPWGRFLRARAALDEFIYEEIDLRRAEVAAGEEHDDVLSLLLEARYDDGTPMSDEELRDELVTVLGAGHETTATGLAWAMERLLRTPRALEKLRESLAAGDDDYLGATVKETLRTRPVIIDVARRLTAPAEIGGYDWSRAALRWPRSPPCTTARISFPSPTSSGPSASSTKGPTITPGSPSAAAYGAASALPSPNTRCGSSSGRSSTRAELSAPDPKPERVKVRNITLAPGSGTRVRLDQPLR